MTMEEALSLIQSVGWQGSRLGLERMETLMALLGNPQQGMQFVHVAGTNGKGSVSAMLSSILTATGYTTGLYTSPHLVSYLERMRVDGAEVTPAEFCALAETVALCATGMEDKPTEFELITAMALLHFAQRGCDIVVLEVGLGGRLDATNIIPPPEVAVLMTIDLEHTEVLGDTLTQIAREKAGIVKEGCAVVAYPGPQEVESVFQTVCTDRHASLLRARFRSVTLLEQNLEGQRFHWGVYFDLHLPLLGEHQVFNAVMALETVELLRSRGWHIPVTAVREGLARVRWPARLELLCCAPHFLLDGAHNPQCAQALAQAIRHHFPGQTAVFLTGVLADKDYKEIMAHLLPLAQSFVCVTPLSDRALSGADLAAYLTEQGADATACDDVPSGLRSALSAAGEGGLVVACGSLYLAGAVGEAFRPTYRRWLRRQKIAARDRLSPEERERLSRQIVARIVAWPGFQAAKTVLIYRATRGEVRLEALENAPEAEGKRLTYPLCTSDTEMVALLPEGPEAWAPGYCGIEEPVPAHSQEIPPEEVDLVICPCTVFDEACNRMGMGAGFYDRYLTRCTRARVASVAFQVQKAHQVPTDPWDQSMEITFTEQETYHSGAVSQNESRK